jgi:hypothetical protein
MVLSIDERVFLVEYVVREGNRYTDLVQKQFAGKFPETPVPHRNADLQKVLANKIKRVQFCIDAQGHYLQHKRTVLSSHLHLDRAKLHFPHVLPKLCMHLLFPSQVPDSLYITTVFIGSPKHYLVNSATFKAPHHAAFSTLLLLPVTSSL